MSIAETSKSESQLNLHSLLSASMSDQTSTTSHSPNDVVDPYQFLQILLNPDGTLSRLYEDPHTPPTSDPALPISVLTKDIIFNQSNHTFLRIFLPRKALDHSSSSGDLQKKLPLIIYFHGGGFIMWSAVSKLFHDFCEKIANHVHAVVVSVEYRLAPEHRLPAAYDDAMEALHWIKTTEEDWLTQYADYSNCYLMGSSAGGNIAYHAGLHTVADDENHGTLKIRGLILHQPFFSGTKRTASESRAVIDRMVPLCTIDLMGELALPMGGDLDHEYFNLTVGDGVKLWGKMKELGWRVLVTGCDGDPLIDREREMVRMMEEKGVKVVGHFEGGNYHAFEIHEPLKASPLLEVVKDFISAFGG